MIAIAEPWRSFLVFLGLLALLAFGYALLRVSAWFSSLNNEEGPAVRGRTLSSLPEIQGRAAERFGNDPAAKRFQWGHVPLPPTQALTHFLLVGVPGSGKTVSIRLLLLQVLRSLEAGQRVFLFDPKGDYWPFVNVLGYGEQALLIHPYRPSAPGWDIARDVRSVKSAQAIVAALLPNPPGVSDPHWNKSARALMKGAILAFQQIGSDWSFWDLLVACASKSHLLELLDASEQPDLQERLRAKHGSAIEGSIETLATAVDEFRAPAQSWFQAWKKGQRFSLSDWVSGQAPPVLVMGYDEVDKASLQPIVRSFFGRAFDLLLHDDEHEQGPRTWVFLDELPAAGRIPELSTLILQGRSKGISVLLGTQSVNALRPLYREPGEVSAILSAAKNRAYMKANDKETAEWAAGDIGKWEGLEKSYNSSSSSSQGGHDSTTVGEGLRVVERYAAHPSEFLDMKMPDDEGYLDAIYSTGLGVWPAITHKVDFPPRPPDDPGRKEELSGHDFNDPLVWSDEDRARLKLPPKAASARPSTNATPSRFNPDGA